MIDNEITHEILDNIIIEAINTIRFKKKRPDVSSTFEYYNKESRNSNITSTLVNTNLNTVTINGKLEIKYPYALESCKSKRPLSTQS